MTTRTFIQNGQGYGPTPVAIVAKIDGNVVFSGNVPTVNQPLPILPDPNVNITTNLYTWTNDLTFSGEQDFELTVENGTLLLTKSLANYSDLVPLSTEEYNPFFYEIIDGVKIYDAFTNEKIDGVTQIEHPDPASLTGQWWWVIPSGSTFTATLNIMAGNANVKPSV